MPLKELNLKRIVLAAVIFSLASQYNLCWAQELALAKSIGPVDMTDKPALQGKIYNADPGIMQKIDDLTRRILLKIIELERFNINYSMNVAKQGRWKGWRYGGLQEVNAGMGLAGSTINAANLGSHLHSVNRIWTQSQESGAYITMIGSIIGASAAALEFWINEYHDLEAARKGFSPRAASTYVQNRTNEINDLLDQRDKMLKQEENISSLSAHAKVDLLEGKILKDLRDQAVLEFVRFHINARSLLGFQQAQYFFDLSKFTLNAIGYEFAFLSAHRHHRLWNYRAGIIWDIAGPIYMSAPIISRLIGKGVGGIHRHRLKSLTDSLEDGDLETLKADEEALNKCCGNMLNDKVIPLSTLDREQIYKTQNDMFVGEMTRGLKTRANSKLSATQNIGAGLFVGACKLSQGILFTIPGYYYHEKTLKAKTVTACDLFSASVIIISSQAFVIADTLRIQLQGEIQRHKMLKAGTLPAQVADRRLKELDKMENRLKLEK